MNRDTIFSLSLAAGTLSDDLLQWMRNAEEHRPEHAERYRDKARRAATEIAAALADEAATR